MPLVKCIKNKERCGTMTSSSCVSFEGQYDDIIKKEVIDCDANLDDILHLLSSEIKKLKDATNVDTFNGGCITILDSDKLVNIVQKIDTLVCTLKTNLETLQTTVNNITGNNTLITIDLDCLTPEASGCAVNDNTYTIYTVLNILKNEICNLKNP